MQSNSNISGCCFEVAGRVHCRGQRWSAYLAFPHFRDRQPITVDNDLQVVPLPSDAPVLRPIWLAVFQFSSSQPKDSNELIAKSSILKFGCREVAVCLQSITAPLVCLKRSSDSRLSGEHLSLSRFGNQNAQPSLNLQQLSSPASA